MSFAMSGLMKKRLSRASLGGTRTCEGTDILNRMIENIKIPSYSGVTASDVNKNTTLAEFLDKATAEYKDSDEKQKVVLPLLYQNIVGHDSGFISPFGPRRIVCCDYFSSSKCLSFIEDHLRQQVLPYYSISEPGSECSTENGQRISNLVEESKRVIKEIVNGSPTLGSEMESCVFFTTGIDSTSAIGKLICLLHLNEPEYWNTLPKNVKPGLTSRHLDVVMPVNQVIESKGKISRLVAFFKSSTDLKSKTKLMGSTFGFCEDDNPVPEAARPVVFLSVHEHYANILAWSRDTVADVIFIGEENGSLSLEHLEKKLKKYKERPLKMGYFCAGSSVTGALNDVDEISSLLHAYGALSCFDYSGIGSGLEIDMNPSVSLENRMSFKDFVIITPHRFPGGPGTQGVLVGSSATLRSLATAGKQPNNKEEAKTLTVERIEMEDESPKTAVLESIKSGIVFVVKESVGNSLIRNVEDKLIHRIREKLSEHPSIKILGNLEKTRVPVISFLIMNMESGSRGDAPFFHYNFITLALNDIFGIQARGGCLCSASQAGELLGISENEFKEYEDILSEKLDRNGSSSSISYKVLKPGFTRLGFSYVMPQEDVDFILDALIWLSRNAYKILPHYDFNAETGQWFSKASGLGKLQKQRSFNASTTSLFSILAEDSARKASELNCPSHKECLEQAEQVLKIPFPIRASPAQNQIKEQFYEDEKARRLKWFITIE